MLEEAGRWTVGSARPGSCLSPTHLILTATSGFKYRRSTEIPQEYKNTGTSRFQYKSTAVLQTQISAFKNIWYKVGTLRFLEFSFRIFFLDFLNFLSCVKWKVMFHHSLFLYNEGQRSMRLLRRIKIRRLTIASPMALKGEPPLLYICLCINCICLHFYLYLSE